MRVVAVVAFQIWHIMYVLGFNKSPHILSYYEQLFVLLSLKTCQAYYYLFFVITNYLFIKDLLLVKL